MKTRNTFIALLIGLSLNTLSQTTNTSNQAKSISIDWLSGDQPKLLTAMANSNSSREELNGTSMSIGTLLGGWHAQAVGQYGDYIYVGFSDGKLLDPKVLSSKKDQSDAFGKLWIYNTKTKQGQLKDLEKGYAHPCSIQITGKYLAIAIEAAYGTNQEIGIEREQHSMVLIFDLEKDPNCSVEASRIVQDGMNCGGAGLAYNPQLKCWFMLVDQDTDDGKVAIYKTANENINSWQKEPIAKYRRFGSGAGLNLITASDNSIWGLFYDTNEENLPSFSSWVMSGDEVKLFKLIEPNGTPVQQRVVYSQVVSMSSPKLKTAGELLADRPGMRFGAGIRYEGGKLELLTCQRNMASTFNIDRTPIADGARTQVMFVNMSKSRGEMACSSSANSSQNVKIQKKHY